jgi:hypothetical protein
MRNNMNGYKSESDANCLQKVSVKELDLFMKERYIQFAVYNGVRFHVVLSSETSETYYEVVGEKVLYYGPNKRDAVNIYNKFVG